jgi:hypothetical protein
MANSRSIENIQRYQSETSRTYHAYTYEHEFVLFIDMCLDTRRRCYDLMDLRRMSMSSSINLDYDAVDLQGRVDGKKNHMFSTMYGQRTRYIAHC